MEAKRLDFMLSLSPFLPPPQSSEVLLVTEVSKNIVKV